VKFDESNSCSFLYYKLNRKFDLDKIPYGRRTSQVLPYSSAVHAAMFFNIEVLYRYALSSFSLKAVNHHFDIHVINIRYWIFQPSSRGNILSSLAPRA
jgi:hypothetical protein